jgi:integrase
MARLANNYADPLKFAQSRKTIATQKLYTVALRAFANHVNIPFENLQSYLQNPRLEDLTTFAQDLSAGTRKGYISVVRSWLEYNDVIFTKKELDEIRVTVRRDDMTKQEPLTVDIIRKMCDVANLQGRALFITLLCTGCRIEELLLTEVRDVDLEKGTIHIRGDVTKTKVSRYVILSFESMKILETWLQEREAYLKSSQGRGQFVRGPIIRGENRRQREIKREDLLFPYTYQTARSLFATAIRKVFNIKMGQKGYREILRREWGDLYDPQTGRGKLHIHSFRTTFRMELSKGARSELCEKLMGHESYLLGAYRDMALDDMIKEYRASEEFVTVYPTDTLKQKLMEATHAEEKNRADIEGIRKENVELRKQMTDLVAEQEKERVTLSQAELQPEYQELFEKFKAELLTMQKKKK